MNQRNPHQQHNVSTMDNIHPTIPRRKKSTDSQAPLYNPSLGINFNQSQHQSQQRQHQRQRQHPQQRQRQHSQQRLVYNPSPNDRISTQQLSNNHNHQLNSKVAGASTSTNQPSSIYSNYYPSGIPSVLARSIDEDLLSEGRHLVDPQTRQAIDDADRRREQSRLRAIKFQAKQKEKADANNLALKRDGLRALVKVHDSAKGGVVEIVKGSTNNLALARDGISALENIHNTSGRRVVEIVKGSTNNLALARDGIRALENMHQSSTHTTNNYGGRVVEIVEDGLRALENMHKNSIHCNTHTTNNYGGSVVEIVEDGLRALENMHQSNTHTTNNYGGSVVEIVKGRTPNEQDEDRLNCNEDHNEEAAIAENPPDNQDRGRSRNDYDYEEDRTNRDEGAPIAENHPDKNVDEAAIVENPPDNQDRGRSRNDYDYEEDRTNRDEGAPIAENHPDKNVDRDSSTSARYRSMIPVFRKRGLQDDIIYSLLNEGPNDNVDPNMQRADDANPFRVDMFQYETLMAVNNLLYKGEMPNDVIPNGEDTTYITRFCEKYKDPLHDFIHGRGVFDFVQEEKKTGLDHTYQIINREYSQFGNTAHMNGCIKKAFADASTLSHERRFELSQGRNGGTSSRRHGTTTPPPPPPRGRRSNGNSSNKRQRT
ncbi:hypothetical protein FRACYDRAFT_254494 [Fragilariopsis cylindrus CCMP1102]|uniref:Uncharacterized protein n=1 Tax=Fragilariopsis cylindrus CCMP1102 TaxID=635003 RepID=A0A1E7EKU1_9STRA|nr:hypothetical protein FRACYDRAFT_254494 [Fragilariopsis cylindrus CCMP1102]|eukprot:OEU06477.1 hypothetical protein FRACYDRAFT_254494 [Fragilariopsis cylindrus CCMP1102]